MSKQRGKSHKASGNRKVHDENEAEEVNDQETHQEQHFESSFHQDGKLIKFDKKQRKKRALLEFRCMVEDAILENYLLVKTNKNLSASETRKARDQLKEITLWGVPLLPSKGHEGTDIVLVKFLKARDFKVHEAFEMLRRTLKWRKEYNADGILEENLDPSVEKIVYISSRDKEGHPLYFNVFGALRDRDLYHKIFGTKENCEKFLRWRVQFIEKGIKELNFRVGGADSIVLITDLKNSPGPAMKELHYVSKKALITFQEHYPELIYRDIIINAPFWDYASHVLSSKLMSQRTKNKFVFARPSKVTKTLLKFIAPENLPVEYGGLKRENDDEFFHEDKVLDLIVKKNSTKCIQIPVDEVGVTIVWDLTVVGWEVSYKEEFIPDDEGSYKVLLQNEKERKGTQSVRNSFYISEPGKIAISIDNGTYKKKKVLYRYKTKPTVPMYIILKKETLPLMNMDSGCKIQKR